MMKKIIFSNILNKLIYNKGGKNNFIILLYHRIGEVEYNSIPSMVHATQDEFEREIIFLKRHYNIISCSELLDVFRYNISLPKRSLIITFDDGYKDNYTNAFPVLKKYNIPAIIFLSTNYIGEKNGLFWIDKVAWIIDSIQKESVDIPGLGSLSLNSIKSKNKTKLTIIRYLTKIQDSQKNEIIDSLCRQLKVEIRNEIAKELYLSEDEIRDMSKNGIMFGGHGCSHSILTKISIKQAMNEVRESKIIIERIIEKKIDFFAYPNGSFNDFNEQIIEIVQNSGYRLAFTTVLGSNNINDRINLFALRRIPTGKSLSELKKNIFLYA